MGQPEVIPRVSSRLSPEAKVYITENWRDQSPIRMHAFLRGHCKLKSIQNLVFRLRKRMWNNDVSQCTSFVRQRTFLADIDRTTPFFFGPQTLPNRLLGRGTKTDPLLLGLCTKASLELLETVNRKNGYLCVDATYCLNNRGFPVVIYGVADKDHSFRLVAIFLVSNEKRDTYRQTLMAMCAIASCAVGIDLQPSFVLSDGAKSISRACIDFWPDAEHIMCYAHMMRAARRNLRKKLDEPTLAKMVQDIRRIHRTNSIEEYQTVKNELFATWPANVQRYMTRNWLEGINSSWQRFRGLKDLPYSNQGQESYNRLLKEHFTMRRKCKMSECIDALFRAAQYSADRLIEQEEEARVNNSGIMFATRSGPGHRNSRVRNLVATQRS